VKAVVQRVSSAEVRIQGNVCAAIRQGYLILVGFRRGDTPEGVDFIAAKCASLRVMQDGTGKMNLSLTDVGGKALVVSQFTLYADASNGNRPSFVDAASAEEAKPLYNRFVARLQSLLGSGLVLTGSFGADMQVTLTNDGPVTILIESPDKKQPLHE
jgi:D-tyrosyl-tRNA(Tyr) deacylase